MLRSIVSTNFLGRPAAAWLLILGGLLPVSWAADNPSEIVGKDTQMERSVAMSSRVDDLLKEHLQSIGWEAAPKCEDAEFLRRVYLDLTGELPTGADVLDFLEDQGPKKRIQVVERLLDSPASAAHLARVWSSWLLPAEDGAAPFQPQPFGLEAWLAQRFEENLRYDRLVADLLVSSGPTESGPTGFFVALGGDPSRIASKTARVFMGVQLDCAECHDHPFDDWTQQDFWGFAAYFAQLSTDSGAAMRSGVSVADVAVGEVSLPDTEQVVAPKPLVQTGFSGIGTGSRRQQLTLWLTARENPFLARATVNRVWSLLFGRGLVEPIDDMRSLEIASHPELLRELSEYFASTGYDLRDLFSVLAKTAAYSRSSRHPSGVPPEASYASMTVKPLTQAQLSMALNQVSRQLFEPGGGTTLLLQRQLGQLRGDESEAKLGIINALVTLNGSLWDRISRENSSRLLKALEGPHLNGQKQLQWLFLTTLSRLPSAEEVAVFSEVMGRAPAAHGNDAADDSQEEAAGQGAGSGIQDAVALPLKPDAVKAWQSDLLWALLNSTEFAMTP
ncbi:DUF1549 domain-containing protein [Aureliella helgolandensis]|nr:DUF1549 domain-containing protein [Aureliella helgolandensis]